MAGAENGFGKKIGVVVTFLCKNVKCVTVRECRFCYHGNLTRFCLKKGCVGMSTCRRIEKLIRVSATRAVPQSNEDMPVE
ncbi:hypothetical protein KSB_65080 [Ktedonobacter robiniae]|uniref:Uncharacterized protein n=1 Tax=Ktedonobacter robiniae TaxID=2778365 RepID=A0ABQ3UZ18_9CHLR|nr:hypothetical protein KSB_65080 [Ktedonobacter robiniae]